MIALLLPSPNTIALPGADRRDAPPSETRALVAARWPEIERLVADDRPSEGIAALETLAVEMRRATGRDAPLFREALTLGRSVLYDDVAELGRATGCRTEARDALSRCAEWDEELRSHLEELVS